MFLLRLTITSTITLGPDRSISHYILKKCLLKSSNSKLIKILTIEPDINSQNLMLALAFGRFLMFEAEDASLLVKHNNETLNGDFHLYPGFNFSTAGFHGLNLFPHSLANERSSWEVLYNALKYKLE